MIDIEVLRSRLVDQLPVMRDKTGLWGGTHAVDARLDQLLRTLAMIDESSDEYTTAWRTRREGDFGPLGPGFIEELFAPPQRGHSAAADVFAWHAALAAEFGWLDVRRLSDDDWATLRTDDLGRFAARDWSREDLARELPEPSLVVGDRVVCFAPADPAASWVYFDCGEHYHREGVGWRRDSPLRAVRYVGRVRDTMVVTPYGRVDLVARGT